MVYSKESKIRNTWLYIKQNASPNNAFLNKKYIYGRQYMMITEGKKFEHINVKLNPNSNQNQPFHEKNVCPRYVLPLSMTERHGLDIYIPLEKINPQAYVIKNCYTADAAGLM